MRLDISLQQKQQLQLKLAPQMIQAIEILQLPNIDLKDRIELELAENEVLEVDDRQGPASSSEPSEEKTPGETTAADGADSWDDGVDATADAEMAATIERLTVQAEEDRFAGPSRSRAEGQEASDRKMEALQATAAPPPTLQERVADQISLLEAPDTVLLLARAVAFSLDAEGFLPIHPMARAVIEATDVDGFLVRPVEDVVDGLRDPGDAKRNGNQAAAAPAPDRWGSSPYGSWSGARSTPAPRRPRDAERAAAQREARRKDKEVAREQRRREAARVVATAASLRRRLSTEDRNDDPDDILLLFPLVEILDVVETEGVDATLDEAEYALTLVQGLEPHGIAGRTAQETLLLQLEPRDPNREKKAFLIRHHLEDWKKNRLPRIAQSMSLSLDELKSLLGEMRELRARPGAELKEERSAYLHPDVIIQWTMEPEEEPSASDRAPDNGWGNSWNDPYRKSPYGDAYGDGGGDFLDRGGYEVKLVNEYFPTLRISTQYLRLFEDASTTPEMKEMIKKKIGSARWLIDAIRQRQDTLRRVVKQIVKHQKEFLDHGLTAMKPLKMQRIADDLGIHVSTVSRAIADKHAQTPQGILPLKFFFHGATASRDGSVESRLSVKDRVRQAIEEEDKSKPFSDEDLAKKFKAEGLSIARRTVTKYRKQLGLPSSRERRQWA
ncbi:MAG: RNA polymerase factor sigma-54 [Planctomycetota bacterium]|jgi:DNA-directed RNA polymerase specialized sigma54-like protein